MNNIEAKCCMYIDLIEANGNASLLGIERAKLHEEICNLIGIPHEQTKHITSNLNGISGRQLCSKLYALKEDLKTKKYETIISEEILKIREMFSSTNTFTKDNAVIAYNKITSLFLNCPENVDVILFSTLKELERRYELVFKSNIVFDSILSRVKESTK